MKSEKRWVQEKVRQRMMERKKSYNDKESLLKREEIRRKRTGDKKNKNMRKSVV